MAQVQQAICASDEDLARLLDGFQPDNVLLISDHGSRRVKGDFLLHVWLRDHGYCVQADRTPAEQAATMNWLLKRWFQNRNGWSGIAEKALRGASRNLALRFPDSLARPVWSQLEQIAPFARQQVLLSPEIDLSKSPLLLGSSYSGLLHLNIQGRDPSGVIGNRERSAFVAELVSKLAGISDPFSGEPLFSAVHTADQLYDGPASQYAPELILDSYDSPWNTLATFRRGFFGEQIRHRFFADNHKDFGHHSREGIFVFSGVDLASNGRSPRKGSVMDVPATLLYLCGVPIPEDYDGQALLELIDPRFVERNPLQRQPGDDPGQAAFDKTYSTEEADLLIQHLQALGYLE
jgi:predicted AlkP superfamily phosphohydrolase/phosphomutase